MNYYGEPQDYQYDSSEGDSYGFDDDDYGDRNDDYGGNPPISLSPSMQPYLALDFASPGRKEPQGRKWNIVKALKESNERMRQNPALVDQAVDQLRTKYDWLSKPCLRAITSQGIRPKNRGFSQIPTGASTHRGSPRSIGQSIGHWSKEKSPIRTERIGNFPITVSPKSSRTQAPIIKTATPPSPKQHPVLNNPSRSILKALEGARPIPKEQSAICPNCNMSFDSNELEEHSITCRPQLRPCSICGRKFASDRLPKHMDICSPRLTTRKNHKKPKRQKLDMTAQRTADLAPPVHKPRTMRKEERQPKPQAVPKWKRDRENLRVALGLKREEEGRGKVIEVLDQRKECPICSRKFNEDRFDRHLQICRNNALNMKNRQRKR